MNIDPTAYQPIPGHPDLMWKASDDLGARGPYYVTLLAKSITARRSDELGARLEIVPGYRIVGTLSLPSSFDIRRTSIEEWLCEGGMKTRYFGSITGREIEALSLYADVAAIAQECLGRKISHLDMEILDGTPYKTAIQFEDGEKQERVRLSLIVYFSHHLAVISHLYKRRDFDVVRCPLPVKILPSTDGGHRERVRTFFEHRGYRDESFLEHLELMSTPVFDDIRISEPTARREYVQRQGMRGNYAVEADTRSSSLAVLEEGPILVPGNEFLHIGTGMLPVASFMNSSRGRDLISKDGGAAFFQSDIADITPEEETAGKEAMHWIESFCAHFFWRTACSLSIHIDRPGDKGHIEIRCGIKSRGRGAELQYTNLGWELASLIRDAITQCITRSGGLRFPTVKDGTFHDGCGHIASYMSREFTASPDLVAPETSGHMRLTLAERAKAPDWLSLGARRKITQALKLF